MLSALFVFGALAILAILVARRSRKRDLPAGPPPIPLLGNVFDLMATAGSSLYSDGYTPSRISKSSPSLPGTPMHVLATRWALSYGPVVHIHVLSQSLVFLSSTQAVFDLLEKRGAIYSDKPHMVMAGELCGCQNMVAFTPYSAQSKRQRRLLTSAFGSRAIPQYEPLIQQSTVQFLDAVLSGAAYDRLRALTRRYAGGLTLAVVYGYVPIPLAVGDKAEGDPDPFISLASDCVDILQNKIASGGGIWAVDVLPWLKHLPLENIPVINRLPGLDFQRKARIWKAKMEDFVEAPWAFVRAATKSGNFSPSFCSSLLEERQKNPIVQEGKQDTFNHDLKWTANSMYSASSDTTISLILSFIRAISLHPECARLAQKEIDTLTGGTRLPTLGDREQLPYISALYTETLRWACPVPLCLPHRLMEDDMYDGAWIPKGSLIIGNIWAILRDETMYPDPHAFKPERWLHKSEEEEEEQRRDPRNYVFGFGRRRCPGALLIESSGWLLMAGILATFDVAPSSDEEVKWEGGVFRTPAAFDLNIAPRSEAAVSLVRRAKE